MTTYFMCPRPPANANGIIPPSGGIWVIHRLVSLLNEIGCPAFVWTPNSFECWWDAHPINPDYIVRSIQPGRGDTVVVPEMMWPAADMNGARQVAFVQNYIWLDAERFRQNPGDTLVCSRFLANHMQRVFNARLIGKVTPYLDDDVWAPTPKIANRVMLLSRRNAELSAQVRALIAENGFEVDYVTEPLSQRQLAEHFNSAEFYVHTVYPEGFPMVCLEAMRSGTIVVGTTGGGGNELWSHDYSGWVVQDPENGRYFNNDEFARRIVEGLVILRNDPDRRSRIWKTAFDWSLRYTAEATKTELQEIFG